MTMICVSPTTISGCLQFVNKCKYLGRIQHTVPPHHACKSIVMNTCISMHSTHPVRCEGGGDFMKNQFVITLLRGGGAFKLIIIIILIIITINLLVQSNRAKYWVRQHQVFFAVRSICIQLYKQYLLITSPSGYLPYLPVLKRPSKSYKPDTRVVKFFT